MESLLEKLGWRLHDDSSTKYYITSNAKYMVFLDATDEYIQFMKSKISLQSNGKNFNVEIPQEFYQICMDFVENERSHIVETYRTLLQSSYPVFVFEHAKADAIRDSELHSWYKHLDTYSMAFPIILNGQEPRNNFSPSYDSTEKERFHWRIVKQYIMNDYTVIIGNVIYKGIPPAIQHLMKKFPIYLDGNFGSGTEEGKTLVDICIHACKRFHKHVSDIKP